MSQVTPYKSRLDKGNACEMALLSKLVYEKTSDTNQHPNESRILAMLQNHDSDYLSVEGFDNKSAQSMLVEHKEFIVMVFRGTNELLDWLDNIDVRPHEELAGKFHKGFWMSLEDVWSGMMRSYQAMHAAQRRPLFFTGHSLGGAIATVAAARFAYNDWPFIATYTFGQPRAVHRDSETSVQSRIADRFHRFQNNSDIVTRVPARIMDYRHVGKCRYIETDKSIHTDPGKWFKFLDMLEGSFDKLKTFDGFDMIDDHSIEEYIAAVEEWNLED